MIFREWSWQRRVSRMRKYRSTKELLAKEGPPDHKVDMDHREIWHYPLGLKGGRAYSIHVCVSSESISQAYVVGEPAIRKFQ